MILLYVDETILFAGKALILSIPSVLANAVGAKFLSVIVPEE
jgi:hypothetical protein